MDLRRLNGGTEIRKAVFVQTRKVTEKNFLLAYSQNQSPSSPQKMSAHTVTHGTTDLSF